MAIKQRIIETNNGHQGNEEVENYNCVARDMRDKGFLKDNVGIVLDYGIDKGHVLDIGSGPGYFGLEWLKRCGKADLKTIEISQSMIEIAQNNAKEYGLEGRVENILGDAGKLPFADNSFDGVISNASLHEWQEPEKVFLEILRVLKPAGRFCIIDVRRDLNKATLSFMKDNVNGINNKKGFMDSVYASYTIDEMNDIISGLSCNNIAVEDYMFGIIIKGYK